MRWRNRRDDDDDEFEDPEETVESVTASVYQNVLVRKAAVMGLVFAGFLALTAADYVFAFLALWHLPAVIACLLAGFMLGEFSVLLRRWLHNRKGSRAGKAEREAMTEGERMNASLDYVAAARNKPLPKPWWMTSPLRGRFWTGLAIRSVYSAGVGVVVTAWTGLPAAGVAAGLAWTVLALMAGYSARPAVTGVLTAMAFADPRPPRESPEM